MHLRRWADHFAARGHEVHVVTTDDAAAPGDARVRLHRLGMPRGKRFVVSLALAAVRLPAQALRLRRLLRTIAPDVVNVHYLNEAALFAVLAGVRPVILTAWGSDILVSPRRSRVRRAATTYVLKRVDLTTCDANHMKRSIEDLGSPPEKVRVMLFGSDTQKFHPRHRDDAWRAKVADPGDLLVLSYRNLEPVYDVETLLRAAPAVLARRPEARFVVGGSGALREGLEGLARDLGVAHRVHFLGRISQADLPTVVASCDAYVSTALSDGGIAASTTEAMLSSIPVVVTDVGDNRDWIRDGEAGHVVPRSDPAALADRLVALLGDAAARAEMGEAGRRIIVERHNVDVEMEKMERVYRDLAASVQGSR